MCGLLKSLYSKRLICLLLMLPASYFSFSQEEIKLLPVDSIKSVNKSLPLDKHEKTESAIAKTHSPRKAALRSAILPGLGQIYNKKYWKLPLVYGALGTTAGIFFYNLKNYRDTRFAFNAKYKAALQPPLRDSTDYLKINPKFLPLSLESLRSYRNQFRREVDYWALYFLLAWALNIVDATVDAHLKSFDVSPDLSLQIKPGRSEMAGTNGISLVLTIGKTHSR